MTYFRISNYNLKSFSFDMIEITITYVTYIINYFKQSTKFLNLQQTEILILGD